MKKIRLEPLGLELLREDRNGHDRRHRRRNHHHRRRHDYRRRSRRHRHDSRRGRQDHDRQGRRRRDDHRVDVGFGGRWEEEEEEIRLRRGRDD